MNSLKYKQNHLKVTYPSEVMNSDSSENSLPILWESRLRDVGWLRDAGARALIPATNTGKPEPPPGQRLIGNGVIAHSGLTVGSFWTPSQ